MKTFTVSCPHCQESERIVKYGTTNAQTQRAKCNACGKTFSLNPKSRQVTPEKEETILRLLEERTSIRGI